ncbi:hypothetical protein KBA63_04545 [Candidatus Woesebacteria bacterium]|jgi:hypothetical protein|nr:hypothetical protein [Candidatus Woesebacteria bacterium]
MQNEYSKMSIWGYLGVSSFIVTFFSITLFPFGIPIVEELFTGDKTYVSLNWILGWIIISFCCLGLMVMFAICEIEQIEKQNGG